MSFEVDRYSSAWAHIAHCADLTWATEPPDEFIVANQRLWAQHCRVSQVLQDTTVDLQCLQAHNSCEAGKFPFSNGLLLNYKQLQIRQNQENGSYNARKSVKDVIPESRLAQYYGNFYYDEVRERCYTPPNDKSNARSFNGQGCENSDLTECWMLPEVDFWFRKLLDEPADRNALQRRRRQFKISPDEDFERWDSSGVSAGEEAALAARVHGVKALWNTQSSQFQAHRIPSPPSPSRKIRARRRQPRRLAALAPPPPAYCLNVPTQLFCDPSCKFQFDTPRQPQLNECQRAMSRLSASVQAVMRASAARCPPYRGTNVSRYAPTSQRPARCPDKRYGVWWPRDHPASRLDKFRHAPASLTQQPQSPKVATITEVETKEKTPDLKEQEEKEPEKVETTEPPLEKKTDEESEQKEKVINDGQQPCTSATAAAVDAGLRKKRLYSTVLSMSAPAPINLTSVGCVRLSQKLVTPGILKLNPKIVLPAARIRPPNVDNKFEELEKEALEQYKASDESIDTKFRELEKQAVEQYSTSNSNTSCSSGNSAEKQASNATPVPENEAKNKKQSAKFPKDKTVDSVVIYSQNFPDLNQAKSHTNSEMNLKNFHTPPRGEKKEQNHRSKTRSLKSDSQRAASDTDYEARETNKGSHKTPMRWTLHVAPKKRHLTSCASDFSSDEELQNTSAIKDAGPCMKSHTTGKMKMSAAHGAGDLHPLMRKT